MRTLLIITLLVLVSTSCKTSFRITVKEPAAVKVPESVTNVAVIDKVDNSISVENVAGTILNAEPFNGKKIVSEQVPTGVIRGLSNSNKLSGRTLLSDSMHLENGLVNWQYLDSIGALEGLDAFIEIIDVQANTNAGGAVAAASSGKTRTKINANALVNIYVLESRQAVENYRVNKTISVSIKSTGTVIDIVDQARRRKENYRQLGIDLGHRIGKLIYPNWVWVNRKYYTKGSPILKRAKKMIANGNWDIAEKQLLLGIDDGSPKAEGRVYYNLALVKEGQGDLDQAIKYAEISALQFGDKLAPSYISTLQKRKRIIERAANNQP